MIKNKILIIAPHADDEVLGCGGVISKNQQVEKSVIVVSNRLTEKEDKASCNKISKRYNLKYYFLNYKDEYIDMIPISELIKKIEEIYLELLPSTVYIPFFGDINNDHTLVHRACTIAFRKIQKHQPIEVLCYEVPSSTNQGIMPFTPNIYVTLSRKNVADKWKMLSYFTNELREYPNPRSKQGIDTYTRFRGMECNKLFAESFMCLYKII
jgi:LmbE family N-acetylglucosaminyl deacetylase